MLPYAGAPTGGCAPKPTPVRGKVYPSRRQAAKALGVRESTVHHAARRGALDGLGTGHDTSPRKPTIDGVTYDSISAARRALRIDYYTVLKRATFDA